MTVSYRLEFTIEGPPVSQGSMRAMIPKFAKSNASPAIMVDTNQRRLRTWRQELQATLAPFWDSAGLEDPWDGPVTVEATFFLQPPASRQHVAMTKPPDVDKLGRALLDGLEQGGFLRNDARVHQLVLSKKYDDRSRTEVKLTLHEQEKLVRPRKRVTRK